MHADEASKRAKIGEMFTIMRIDQGIAQLVNQQSVQIQRALSAMAAQGKFSAAQQKDTDVFGQKVLGIVKDGINWAKVKPQFVDIYAATYTEQDIDGMLAFYRSPVGQKMLQSQATLSAKSQAVAQQQMQELQPKLRDAFDQFKKEMQVKYPNQMPK